MTEATCRSCGAPILWCDTESGRKMPVDATPVAGGNVRVTEVLGRLYCFAGSGAEGRYPDASTHTSHFATCKNAAQHRKPKVAAPPVPTLFDQLDGEG